MPTAVPQTSAPACRERELPPSTGREGLLAFLLGTVIFLLAFDSGTFTLVSRTTLAVLVWWTLGIGTAIGLWPRNRPTTGSFLIAGALVFLTLLTALSLAWTPDGQAAFAEVGRTLLYLGVFILVIFLAPWTGLRVWGDAIALATTAVALTALISRMFPNTLTSAAPFSFLPFGQARLNYPIGYWNGLAIFVMFGLPFLLRLAVAAPSAVIRATAVGAVPATVAVAYLASSRGGFATGAVAVIATLALTKRRVHMLVAAAVGVAAGAAAVKVLSARPELVNHPAAAAASGEGHSAAALLVGIALAAMVAYGIADAVLQLRSPPRPIERAALAGLALAVVVGIAVSHPRQRFDAFRRLPAASLGTASDPSKAHLRSGSGNGRWQYWQVAYDEFRAHPLEGGGAGSYAIWWLERRPIDTFAVNAHSLYLETLGELGVLGGVALLVLVSTALFVAVATPLRSDDHDASSAALGACCLAVLVAWGIDWMWQLPAVTIIGVAALGLLTANARPATGMRVPLVGRAVAGLIALAAIAVAAVPLLSTEQLHRSQVAAADHDATAALAAANDARRIEPWAYSPYLQLALVHEQLDQLPAARTALDGALRRAPRNWQLWLVKARLDTKSGRIAAARASLRRIRELNPFVALPN